MSGYRPESITDKTLDCRQKVCGCGKSFIVQDLATYVYKIDFNRKGIKYYCCYTHWKKGLEIKAGMDKQKRRIR